MLCVALEDLRNDSQFVNRLIHEESKQLLLHDHEENLLLPNKQEAPEEGRKKYVIERVLTDTAQLLWNQWPELSSAERKRVLVDLHAQRVLPTKEYSEQSGAGFVPKLPNAIIGLSEDCPRRVIGHLVMYPAVDKLDSKSCLVYSGKSNDFLQYFDGY
jgi:hypothetical protein